MRYCSQQRHLHLSPGHPQQEALALLAEAVGRPKANVHAWLEKGGTVGVPGSLHSVAALLGFEGEIEGLTYSLQCHLPGEPVQCLPELTFPLCVIVRAGGKFGSWGMRLGQPAGWKGSCGTALPGQSPWGVCSAERCT